MPNFVRFCGFTTNALFQIPQFLNFSKTVVNLIFYLTLHDPRIFESCIEIKIKLNFYFHTSLWCLKGLHKTFRGNTKKCENKNLT